MLFGILEKVWTSKHKMDSHYRIKISKSRFDLTLTLFCWLNAKVFNKREWRKLREWTTKQSMWLLNCHRCRCSSWRLWYLSFRFDNVWIERGWGSIQNYFHMAQSCKILPPPDPDRQLLHSLALEQLFSPSSWFHLRRSRYTRSMRTSPQLRSQLNQ